MKFRKPVLTLLLMLSAVFLHPAFAQTDYHSPLGIPLVLSSDYGEIRPNHFHMGLDFKTNGREGYRVYAIEKGHVSRIKVSPYGYGRAVYIDHPNGITSVYGHLSRFYDAIDSLVQATQQQEKRFDVDITVPEGLIPIERGQVFALSGNTGGSGGPHLHFELRETESEKALNPQLHGFAVADHRAPELRNLKVYALTADGYRIPGKELNIPVRKSGSYQVSDLTLPAGFTVRAGGIGFAIDAIDRFDGAYNPCGIFGSALIVEGDTLFSSEIRRIAFEHTRYVNAHCDYAAYQNGRHKYHKLFKSAFNPLEIYSRAKTNGIQSLEGRQTLNAEVDTYDVAGNHSRISVRINWDSTSVYSSEDYVFDRTAHVFPDQAIRLTGKGGSFSIPEQAVYEPVRRNTEGSGLHFGEAEEPVQEAFSVRIPKNDPALPVEKYYILVTTANGREHALGTEYEEGAFTAESRYMGSFSLSVDTTAPKVSPASGIGASGRVTGSELRFRVFDSQTDLADYAIYVDDRWYPLEYETKGDYLIFPVPEDVHGSHTFRVVVTDACGNTVNREEALEFR